MNQINDMLKGVDRKTIIQGTAIYMLVYAVLNVCGGVLFGIIGAMSAGIGVLGAATSTQVGSDASRELAQASAAAAMSGGLLLVLGLVSLVSFPFLLASAIGLFQRKRWARQATVIALILSIVLSLLMIGSSFISSLIWIILSAFGVYFFQTDEEIKAQLVN